LDVGGGEGVFLAAAGAAAPRLQLVLFDLPAVAERARRRLAEAGLKDRALLFSGDFLNDPLPEGADLITFVRVLHDHDEAGVRRLLSAARKALAPGGVVLVAEPMAVRPDDRVADVYFAFYLLAMGRGRARRPEEIAALATEAGFSRAALLKTRAPLLVRVLRLTP
jgi:demethylspheroidene O-methyltransferase